MEEDGGDEDGRTSRRMTSCSASERANSIRLCMILTSMGICRLVSLLVSWLSAPISSPAHPPLLLSSISCSSREAISASKAGAWHAFLVSFSAAAGLLRVGAPIWELLLTGVASFSSLPRSLAISLCCARASGPRTGDDEEDICGDTGDSGDGGTPRLARQSMAARASLCKRRCWDSSNRHRWARGEREAGKDNRDWQILSRRQSALALAARIAAVEPVFATPVTVEEEVEEHNDGLLAVVYAVHVSGQECRIMATSTRAASA